MKHSPNIGLSQVIPEGAVIAHSTVIGRKTFGRVADLLCAWATQEHRVSEAKVGALRILISALLESLPEGKLSPTRIEMAVIHDQVHLAMRLDSGIGVEVGGAEKAFTQHWLNSTQMQILRRSIDPRDRIEVRYQTRSHLMEWRVIRPLHEEEVDPNLSSFAVFEDQREDLEEEQTTYRDLGDLPFDQWVDEAYRTSRKASASGEIRIQGEALQGDLDLARIKVAQELDELDRQRIRGGASLEDEEETVTSIGTGMRIIDDLMKQLQKKEILESEFTSLIDQLRSEFRERRKETLQWKKKYQQVVELLNRKEMAFYTLANEMKALQRSQAERKSEGAHSESNPFREKALQMFEKLKEVTEQNEVLRKEILTLKERNSTQGATDFEGAMIRTNTEDLEKKLDRAQRALEAEKVKTSALLERALTAEKEAQSSAPLINDLEAKVEHTLKTSMQYKKEIDSMKQKLVQADAEKNKVKNDFLKAQAQIQTLMKRQAS